MSDLSNYAEGKLVEHLLGVASFTMPSGVHIKLHTGDPGEDGTANASAETTRKAATFGTHSGGASTTTGALDWTNWPSGANGETISHWSAWDASSAGNCLCKGAFGTPKTMATGETFRATTVTFTLA